MKRAVLSVAVLVSLLAVTACGNANQAVFPPTSAKPPKTIAPATSGRGNPTAVAVLQAYRTEWAAFEHAAASANPSDPELAATMVDPQLQGVKANLLADQRQGIVGRGTFTLHPKITGLTATTAALVDCAYSTAELVYASTGKPVLPVTPPENDGVQATLVLTGSTWKVSKQTVTDGSCAPGS